MAVRKAVLDCEVSTDDKTGLFLAFLNGGYRWDSEASV